MGETTRKQEGIRASGSDANGDREGDGDEGDKAAEEQEAAATA